MESYSAKYGILDDVKHDESGQENYSLSNIRVPHEKRQFLKLCKHYATAFMPPKYSYTQRTTNIMRIMNFTEHEDREHCSTHNGWNFPTTELKKIL